MPKKILVVDSDSGVSRQIAVWLKGEGVQVIAASDGESGFMRFKKEKPQAAIVAAQLDKVVGSVLCQRMKKYTQNDGIMVILASEHYGEHPELGKRAVSMFGADGYLVKPLVREELIDVLRPVLKSDGKTTPATSVAKRDETAVSQPTPSAPGKKGAPIEQLPEPPVQDEGPRAKPVHQGNLLADPLPKIFMQMFSLERTGILSLERNRIRRDIYFKNGAPVHATSALRTENPALMLVRDEIITEEEYSNSLALMTERGMSMNEAIVEATSLSFEALYEHVRKYEKEILVNCFAWHEGHFEFMPEKKLPENVPSFDYAALEIIHESSKRHYPLKLLSKPIYEHKEKYAVRTASFSDYIDQLNLEPSELKFALLIDGKNKVSDLVTLGRDNLYETYHLLWALLTAKMIEFRDSPQICAESEFRDVRTKSVDERKALPKKTYASVMREYYRLKSSNYFKALGVETNSSKEDVEKAFQDIESRFHPDNLSKYDIREVQGKIDEILEKARAARRVLLDPRTRREYLHYLQVQERQQAKDNVLQAEISFKEGEKALKNNKFGDARARFEEAIKMQPDEPDYYAYLGWALFMGAKSEKATKPKTKTQADVRRAKQELNRAIAMNPLSDKPYLILGRLFASEGNISAALEHFEKALNVNRDCAPAKVAIDIISKNKGAVTAVPAGDPQAGP